MKKKLVMDGGITYLPKEIITNILKRLPVKLLIQFQCVCKDWKNLFKTPSFIKEHHLWSTMHNNFLLFMSKSNSSDMHSFFINRDMQVSEYPKTLFLPHTSRRIVGSSNGVLCIDCYTNFMLWNPATREIIHLPALIFTSRQIASISLLGFGFSPIVNEYKIVRLSLPERGANHRACLVQVYSSRTKSWKDVEVEIGVENEIINGITHCACTYGVTFEGAIFWAAHHYSKLENKICHGCCLISFDIATESFTFVPTPGHVSRVARLTLFDNKLAMPCRSWMESTKLFSTNLWVMEKCIDALGERWVWTRIDSSTPYNTCFSGLPPIWKNQILCDPGFYLCVEKVMGRNGEVISYNLHTNKSKRLGMFTYTVESHVWNFAERLGKIYVEASSS